MKLIELLLSVMTDKVTALESQEDSNEGNLFCSKLMMKKERVNVYTKGIKKFGHWFNSSKLLEYIGRQVDIRYQEDYINKLYVYSTQGLFISEIKRTEPYG
ncbi:Mu transposase C-terminal domain-containing protein [Vallitalea guaymasensis]|uniref:Mu transposase C-terminal domain-containing protein n=1 Tax=Vallitalea guaymasensis TaxID=1185412 RepID=UPI000DE45B02|nr:Mu transposase C-terminal domain-containing protein [Vallitalea guaymasensis]